MKATILKTTLLLMAATPGCSEKEPTKRPFRQGGSDERRAVDYRDIIKEVPNPTGAYTVRMIDEDALSELTREAAFVALKAVLLEECRGIAESRHELEFSGQVCRLVRGMFPSRGKKLLLRIYEEATGEDIKKAIGYVLAENKDKDIVPELIAGLHGEESERLLQALDYSLHNLTGHVCYEQETGQQPTHWQPLHAYWSRKWKAQTDKAKRK